MVNPARVPSPRRPWHCHLRGEQDPGLEQVQSDPMNGLLCSLLFVTAGAGPARNVSDRRRRARPSGSAVPDAVVRLEVGGAIHEMRTATDGRFAFPGDVGRPARIVTAAGFALATVEVSEASELRISLEPAPFFEAVNVTSSRTDVPRSDPTVTVTVIPASELLSSAAVSVDDALKMVPGSRSSAAPRRVCRIRPRRASRFAAWAAPARAVRSCSRTAFR